MLNGCLFQQIMTRAILADAVGAVTHKRGIRTRLGDTVAGVNSKESRSAMALPALSRTQPKIQ